MPTPAMWQYISFGLLLLGAAVACLLLARNLEYVLFPRERELAAGLLVAGGLFVFGLAQQDYYRNRPRTSADVTIQSILVDREKGNYETHFRFVTDSGSVIGLYAPKRLYGLQVGNRVRITYGNGTKVVATLDRETPPYRYANNFKEINIWIVGTILVFSFTYANLRRKTPSQATFDSSEEPTSFRGTVGDRVAEHFTPTDRPGENWHFDQQGHVLDRVLDHDQIERERV